MRVRCLGGLKSLEGLGEGGGILGGLVSEPRQLRGEARMPQGLEAGPLGGGGLRRGRAVPLLKNYLICCRAFFSGLGRPKGAIGSSGLSRRGWCWGRSRGRGGGRSRSGGRNGTKAPPSSPAKTAAAKAAATVPRGHRAKATANTPSQTTTKSTAAKSAATG